MEDLLLNLFKKIGFEDAWHEKGGDITNNPIKDGEIVLGDMNELEKKCLHFIRKKEEEHKDVRNKIDFLLDKENKDAFESLMSKQYLLEQVLNFVYNMMWISVCSRFKTENTISALGFRDGNKVVSFLNKDTNIDEGDEDEDISPTAETKYLFYEMRLL